MAQQYPPEYSSLPPTPPPPRYRYGVQAVVGVLILVLAVAVIVNETLLRIGKPSVEGNQRVSREEVIQAAGLDRSVSYFAINENKIAEGVNSHRYLIYEGIEKRFPNKLTIYVRERVPVARVQEFGADYFLADDGMVLEKGATKENGVHPEEMVVVTGLKPKELRMGKVIVTGTVEYLTAYRALFEELEKQGYLSQISELNITNPESIYLVTRDGYSAHLGNLDSLRAKIGTVRAVVAKLREMGKTGGMLEASTPAEVIYTPPSP